MIATLLPAVMNIWFREIYSIKVYCTNSEKTTVIFSNIFFYEYLFLIVSLIFIHVNYMYWYVLTIYVLILYMYVLF